MDALNQTRNFLYNIDNTLQNKNYTNAVNATSPVALGHDTNYARMINAANGWGTYSYSYNPYVSTLTNEAFVYVGGYPNTPNPTDTISLTFVNSALSGGTYTMPTWSVPSGDAGNAAQTATDLASAITSNSTLSAAGISAAASGTLVTVSAGSTVSVTASATGSTTATVGGGGQLAQVTNNVIANSPITYSFDALERTTNRMINGGNNNIAWTYDPMSRITAEANALGTFNYAYVDDVPGSSKGTTRLASISYPNGQVTNFSWYGNIGDQRLQSINNLLPSGAPLSQFSYGYDSAGEITRWGSRAPTSRRAFRLSDMTQPAN